MAPPNEGSSALAAAWALPLATGAVRTAGGALFALPIGCGLAFPAPPPAAATSGDCCAGGFPVLLLQARSDVTTTMAAIRGRRMARSFRGERASDARRSPNIYRRRGSHTPGRSPDEGRSAGPRALLTEGSARLREMRRRHPREGGEGHEAAQTCAEEDPISFTDQHAEQMSKCRTVAWEAPRAPAVAQHARSDARPRPVGAWGLRDSPGDPAVILGAGRVAAGPGSGSPRAVQPATDGRARPSPSRRARAPGDRGARR